jgi:glycosyltransferase involved in cell wall biosynthesis
VVSTDISDVRQVLADGALYLELDDPALLIERLRWVVEHRDTARALSQTGMQAISTACAPERVGHRLSDFLFKPSVGERQ